MTTPTKRRRKRGTSAPRPKACVSLDANTVEALRAMVAQTNKRAAANTLAVSDTCVRRVLAGEPVTPALHRLLTLQLRAPNTPNTPTKLEESHVAQQAELKALHAEIEDLKARVYCLEAPHRAELAVLAVVTEEFEAEAPHG